MAMPAVVPAPMPVAPTPMPPMPAPVTVVPVVAPAHLLRLETIDFAIIGDGRMGILMGGKPSVRAEWLRRQRRGLGGGGDCGSARNDAYRNLQKVPAFHDIFLLLGWRVMRTDFRRSDMNGR